METTTGVYVAAGNQIFEWDGTKWENCYYCSKCTRINPTPHCVECETEENGETRDS